VIRQQDPSFKIPDDDHHVTEHMQGVLYPTDKMDGPKYSDYTKYTGKKMGGDQWKKLPTADPMAPEGAAAFAQRSWVELPNCSGAKDEIKLMDGLENATVATCKTGASKKK
jgi:hypothetical protein